MKSDLFHDENQFGAILAEVFQPSQPIKREELLHGRSKQLTSIRRAILSPGTHVFIYGDRGVGKTSLAQTASSLHQDVGLQDIIVSCTSQSKFYELVEDIACLLDDNYRSTERREYEKSGKLGLGFVDGSMKQKLEQGIIPTVNTINEATQLLDEICTRRVVKPVVIIDEFDQLIEESEKKLFADLIKRVSDTGVPIRFIFCGIGSSLQELIGTHLSTDRYIAPIELDPIKHDARWEIIQSGAERFGLSVDRETEVRIGQISDGFPYYIHLIGQYMFWSYFERAQFGDQNLMIDDFHNGVNGAVQNAMTTLKMTYDKATQKYESTKQYDHVLWAMVGSTNFERPLTEVFEKSYIPLCQQIGVDPVAKQTFSNRLSRLKSDAHGEILESPRRSWYKFRENMMRGYVRLVASKNGVDYGPDHHFG